MVDPKRAAKLIREHFENLTTEQFVENLKSACPEVFEDKQENESTEVESWEELENHEKADLMGKLNGQGCGCLRPQ